MATNPNQYAEDAQIALDLELKKPRDPSVPPGETSAPTTLPEYRKFQAERVARDARK